MKLLIEASKIPDGSTVVKRTGTFPYTLRKSIQIHSKDLPDFTPTKIESDGVVFLVDGNNINAIPNTTELLWEVDDERLYKWIANKLDEK